MNPLSSISSIKADIQTAASSIAASVTRAWGHAVKYVTPDQTTPAQAKTNASYQEVAEKRQTAPENPITLQGARSKPKPIPKPPIQNQTVAAPKERPKPIPKPPVRSAEAPVVATKSLPTPPPKAQAQAKPLPTTPNILSMEKEINNHRMETGLSTHSLRDNVQTTPKPNPEPRSEIRNVSSEHVEDIPEKTEKQLLNILQDVKPESNPQVVKKEIHTPQNNSKAELDNLKNLISSLGSKNKLKLNENSELEIKGRSVLSNRDELGTSEKSQAAINNLVGKLIKLSTQDEHSEELLSLANNLKESEWGKEALKNPSVSKNFEILENFLNTKAQVKELTKEFDQLEEQMALTYTKELGKKYDETEQSLKNVTWRHNSLKNGINEIIKNLNTV